MNFLSRFLSSGAGNIIDSVGNVLDKVITTKGETKQLENEMRKAEQAYIIEMSKLGIEERKAELEDIASARTAAATIQTSAAATLLSKNTGPYLALGTVCLTFLLFLIMIFLHPNRDTKEVILYILGVLSASVTQIFSFYFGSSQSSHDKQVAINDLQKKM